MPLACFSVFGFEITKSWVWCFKMVYTEDVQYVNFCSIKVFREITIAAADSTLLSNGVGCVKTYYDLLLDIHPLLSLSISARICPAMICAASPILPSEGPLECLHFHWIK